MDFRGISRLYLLRGPSAEDFFATGDFHSTPAPAAGIITSEPRHLHGELPVQGGRLSSPRRPIPPVIAEDHVVRLSDLLTNPQFLLGVVGLFVLVTLGAVAIAWLRKWVRDENDEDDLDLERFHRLYEQGELSAEEYDEIRRLYARKLNQSTDET